MPSGSTAALDDCQESHEKGDCEHIFEEGWQTPRLRQGGKKATKGPICRWATKDNKDLVPWPEVERLISMGSEALRANREAFEAEMEAMKAELTDYKSAHERDKVELEDAAFLKQEMEFIVRENSSLKQSLVVKERELSNLRKERELLSAQLDMDACESMTLAGRLEATRRDMERSLAEAQAENDWLRRQLQELKSKQRNRRAAWAGRETALLSLIEMRDGSSPLPPLRRGPGTTALTPGGPQNARQLLAQTPGAVEAASPPLAPATHHGSFLARLSDAELSVQAGTAGRRAPVPMPLDQGYVKHRVVEAEASCAESEEAAGAAAGRAADLQIDKSGSEGGELAGQRASLQEAGSQPATDDGAAAAGADTSSSVSVIAPLQRRVCSPNAEAAATDQRKDAAGLMAAALVEAQAEAKAALQWRPPPAALDKENVA